jgi:hypothetical protein
MEVDQSRRPNFVRRPWAKRVEWHVDHIKEFGDRRWERIEKGAAKYIPADEKADSDQDDNEDDFGSDVEVFLSDSEAEGAVDDD